MVSACVAAVKCRPALHHCVVIFSGPQGSWSVNVCCLPLKMEFRSCARGRQWCGIFHYHWWTASIKPRLLFSHSGLVSWGLPFLQSYILSAKQGSIWYHFYNVFGMTRSGIEPTTSRSRGERSNHWATAAVKYPYWPRHLSCGMYLKVI